MVSPARLQLCVVYPRSPRQAQFTYILICVYHSSLFMVSWFTRKRCQPIAAKSVLAGVAVIFW
jgi:hypothetical protein